MLEHLLELDKEIFIHLNGYHNPFWDSVMVLITDKLVWLPLYAYLLYLIFKDYGKEGWIIAAGIILTIVLADQITSSIMKPYFARLRPSHEPTLQSVIHLVDNYKGGKYGFASSHAANTFGIAAFLFLLFRETRKWIITLFAWAAVVTYSRIYLGVHYPGDILAGAIIGILSAFLGFYFYKWLNRILKKHHHSLPGTE